VDLFSTVGQMADVELDVLYWRDSSSHLFEIDCGSGYNYRVLRGLCVRIPLLGKDKLCPGIVKDIWKGDFDIFVVCGLGPTALLAIATLFLLRRRWVFWGERPHPANGSRMRQKVKTLWWRFVGWASCGVMAIGNRAVRSYQSYGIDAAKIDNVPYSPDVSRLLDTQADDQRHARQVRRALIEDDRDLIFLYCGSLIPRKGVDTLIRGFIQFARNESRGRLVIVGDGPERAALESMVPAKIQTRVLFAGTKQRPELYHYYLAADVFVFPSRYDGWAVVINEAMGAGLPTIATDAVGAAVEMIRNGVEGFIVPIDRPDRIAQHLSTLTSLPDVRLAMRRNAVARGEEYSARAGALRMVNALLRRANTNPDSKTTETWHVNGISKHSKAA